MEGSFEVLADEGFTGVLQPFTTNQVPTRPITDGEWIAATAIAQPKVALEINAPNVIGTLAWAKRRPGKANVNPTPAWAS